jgi:hypothetical protein
MGLGLFIIEASQSHSDIPHSVGLLWTSDQTDAETSVGQHTTVTTDRHPSSRRDSNQQSQQASNHRPTPYNARLLWLTNSKHSFFMFVGPCIIVQFMKKFQQDTTMYQNFIIPHLYEAQHVSGDTPPIVRSLNLHWQPLVFYTWKVVGRVAGGLRPPSTRPTTFHVWKTRGCQCRFRLLMMGGVSPETCWASYKYGIIKFLCIVASCWIFHCELYYDARIHERQHLFGSKNLQHTNNKKYYLKKHENSFLVQCRCFPEAQNPLKDWGSVSVHKAIAQST